MRIRVSARGRRNGSDWKGVGVSINGQALQRNPTVEVRESLPDGTEFKAVRPFATSERRGEARNCHFFDRG